MEILRERELRESVEKQMMEDQRMRGKINPFYFLHLIPYFHCQHSFWMPLFQRRRRTKQKQNKSLDILRKKKESEVLPRFISHFDSSVAVSIH